MLLSRCLRVAGCNDDDTKATRENLSEITREYDKTDLLVVTFKSVSPSVST